MKLSYYQKVKGLLDTPEKCHFHEMTFNCKRTLYPREEGKQRADYTIILKPKDGIVVFCINHLVRNLDSLKIYYGIWVRNRTGLEIVIN